MIRWISRLFRRQPPAPEPPLLIAARNPDPAVRQEAATGLAGSTEPWAGETLIKLLQDEATPVRAAAENALRQRGAVALPELLTGLNHADVDLARVAAGLLGETGAAAAVGPLLVALKYNPRPVQVAARRALTRLGPLAATALRAAADEPQSWVRQQIAEILAEIAGQEPPTAGSGPT